MGSASQGVLGSHLSCAHWGVGVGYLGLWLVEKGRCEGLDDEGQGLCGQCGFSVLAGHLGGPRSPWLPVWGRGLLGSDQKHLQPLPAPGSLRPRQPAGSVVGSGWWPGPPCPGAAAHQLTLFAFKLVVKLSCGTIRPEKPKECAGPGFLFGERLSVYSAGMWDRRKHCHSLLSAGRSLCPC